MVTPNEGECRNDDVAFAGMGTYFDCILSILNNKLAQVKVECCFGILFGLM